MVNSRTGDPKRTFVATLRALLASAPLGPPRALWPLGARWPRSRGTDGPGRAILPPHLGLLGRSRKRSGEGRAILRGAGKKLGGHAPCPGASNSGWRVWLGRNVGGLGFARLWGKEAGPRFVAGASGPYHSPVESGVAAIRRGRGEEPPALDSALGQSGGRGAATGVFSRGRCSGRRSGVGCERRGGRGSLRTLPPLLNTMFQRRRGTSRSHGARAARPPGPRSPWT